MGNVLFSVAILLGLSVSCSCLFQQANGRASVTHNNTETPDIALGGGTFPPAYRPDCGDCPLPSPPPPPACAPPPPPPPPCLPPGLQKAQRVIKDFATKIKSDPRKITESWQGTICIDQKNFRGFVCGRKNKNDVLRLAGVNFNGFNFGGDQLSVSDFIEQLDDLVFFHVNSNSFTGAIPVSIDKLNYFYELDLSNNKLIGEFPTSVLGATNLTFLDLRFNTLTGPLPPQVFDLDLDVLFLNNNQLTGYIPSNLGSSPVLYLTLANNNFTGPIPKSIGNMNDTLVEVLFLNNQLSGCLPYEIGLLKIATVFDASKNHLTGPIPHSFGCLARMEQLNLSSNMLYGTVPEVLCKLKNLDTLSLNDNYFTQVGPECRNLIKRNILDMGMNCILDLPGQRTKAQCEAFFSNRIQCTELERKTMTNIPCKITYSAVEETSDEEPPRAPPPYRTYSVLQNP